MREFIKGGIWTPIGLLAATVIGAIFALGA